MLRWATRNGAELMGRGHELGAVREGYLADLLVVDGDPLADIGVLQDQARLLAVMKAGTLVRTGSPLSVPPRTALRSRDHHRRLDDLRPGRPRRRARQPGRGDRGEPARRRCVEYFWSEDLDAANTFRFFECWGSQELLDAHLAQPHEAAFAERNLHAASPPRPRTSSRPPRPPRMPAAADAIGSVTDP